MSESKVNEEQKKKQAILSLKIAFGGGTLSCFIYHTFSLLLLQLGADIFSDIYFPLLSYKSKPRAPRARSLPGHYRSIITHNRSRRTPLSMYGSPQSQSSRYFYPIHSYHSASQSSLNSGSCRQLFERTTPLNHIYYASSTKNKCDACNKNDLFDETNKENYAYNNQLIVADNEHIYYDPELNGTNPRNRCYTIYEENYGCV